jgi:hypothetical protein
MQLHRLDGARLRSAFPLEHRHLHPWPPTQLGKIAFLGHVAAHQNTPAFVALVLELIYMLLC